MANQRNTGMGNVGNRITRRQFIRRAGVAGGAVAAAGLGLSGVAKAQVPPPGLPVTPNPDPAHIDNSDPSYIIVMPVGDSTRKTIMEWKSSGYPLRQQDPRISTFDPAMSDPQAFYFVPLSETQPGSEYDIRRRTPDAMNVEWAANNVQSKDGMPGTVLLKHAPGLPFDFGTGWDPALDFPPGYGVLLCNDCLIIGEKDASGNPLTKIRNGTGIFVANWWVGLLAYGYGVQIWHDFVASMAVKDLIIEDSTYPGLLGYSGFDITNWQPHILGQVEIENVRVLDAKPNPAAEYANLTMLFEADYGTVIIRNCHVRALNSLDPADPFNTGWNFMAGITVVNTITGGFDESTGIYFEPPVGPRLIAENNVLDVASSHLGSVGILVGAAMGAELRGNKVSADIAFLSGDVGWLGGGNLTIENNPGCAARVGGFTCVNLAGNSIEMYNPDFDPTQPPGPGNPLSITYPHPGISMLISGNSVNMDPTGSIDLIHGMSAGMFAQDVFFMGNPANSIKNATVQSNVFTGSADFGVFMGNFWDVPDYASGNSFLYNDFKSLSSSVASVYLGPQTSNNTFGPNNYPPGGAYHEVKDDGSNNRVVGLPANTVTDPGIGQLVSSKIAQSKNANATYSSKTQKKGLWGFEKVARK